MPARTGGHGRAGGCRRQRGAVAAGRASGVVPVLSLGIVEAQFDAIFLARRGKFLQRIALERGAGVNIEIIHGRVKHGEAVMVLGRDDDVFHPGVAGNFHPFLGVKFHWIELLDERRVVRDRNLLVEHDPFAEVGHLFAPISPGRYGIDAPVDKHSKSRLPATTPCAHRAAPSFRVPRPSGWPLPGPAVPARWRRTAPAKPCRQSVPVLSWRGSSGYEGVSQKTPNAPA